MNGAELDTQMTVKRVYSNDNTHICIIKSFENFLVKFSVNFGPFLFVGVSFLML